MRKQRCQLLEHSSLPCYGQCVRTFADQFIGEDRREDITLVCSKMQLACSMAFKCISDHNLDVSYVFERVLDMPHTGFDIFRM